LIARWRVDIFGTFSFYQRS